MYTCENIYLTLKKDVSIYVFCAKKEVTKIRLYQQRTHAYTSATDFKQGLPRPLLVICKIPDTLN